MKRLIAMVAVIALVAGMATAAPSVYGSNGLIRTISAKNAGGYGIGAYVYGWRYATDSIGSTPKKTYMDINIAPQGYFSFNDMFELSLGTTYRMNSNEVGANKVNYNGLLDTRIGLKASFKAAENITLGIYGGYDIPTWSDTLKNEFLRKYNAIAFKDSFKHNGMIDARALAGFSFGAANLDVNAGMWYDLDDLTLQDTNWIYPRMAIPFGLGFSYDMGMLTPYAEFQGMYVMDTCTHEYLKTGSTTEYVERGLLDNPTWVGAGVRMYFSGLNVTVGGEYNLQADSSANSPSFNDGEHWHAVLGLAYAPKAEAGPKAPVTGIIAGKVTDKNGKPLAATISVAGMTFNADPATGNYTAPGLQITGAPVEIKADLKGYIAKTGSVLLTKKNKKKPATQDFVLELKPIPMGTVKGMVKDQLTGAAVDGNVAFGATNVAVKQGAFSANLQAGDYNGVFQAPGYFEKTVSVKVTDKGTTLADAKLVKVGTAIEAAVVWKLAGNAIVKSFAADNIVMAVKDAPKAKIVVTAYVDRVGGAKLNQKLADNRANTVKAELIKAGITGEIMTKGVVVTPTGKTKAAKLANTKVVVTLE